MKCLTFRRTIIYHQAACTLLELSLAIVKSCALELHLVAHSTCTSNAGSRKPVWPEKELAALACDELCVPWPIHNSEKHVALMSVGSCWFRRTPMPTSGPKSTAISTTGVSRGMVARRRVLSTVGMSDGLYKSNWDASICDSLILNVNNIEWALP